MIHSSKSNNVVLPQVGRIFFSLFFGIIIGFGSHAQIGNSFDIGVNVGALSIQSDYGERGDIRSALTGNIGFTTGLSLYKNFYNRNISWNSRSNWLEEHIKLRADISYSKTNLHHFGAYVEGNSPAALSLQAMSGTSRVINFGGMVEFHFLSLSSFSSLYGDHLISPYITLGGTFGLSKATMSSTLGNYQENPLILIGAYRNNAIYTDEIKVGALVFGAGGRLKLNDLTDIVLETKWQSYMSDKIDGLKPRLDANKYLDWMYSISVGFAYSL